MNYILTFLVNCIVLLQSGRFVTSYLSEYTQLLWLKNTEGVDPYTLWTDTESSANSATAKTVLELKQAVTGQYRHGTVIDNWTSSAPAKIRLHLRNNHGVGIYKSAFNATGSTFLDWFNTTNHLPVTSNFFIPHATLLNHDLSFTVLDSASTVTKYFMTSIKLASGQVNFLLASTPATSTYLPATAPNETVCFYSADGFNTLLATHTKASLTQPYCSSFCRDRNRTAAAVHVDQCSCLATEPEGSLNFLCTTVCPGDDTTLCGSPVDSVNELTYFNHIHTDIDPAIATTSTVAHTAEAVTGALEIEFAQTEFLMEYEVHFTLPTAVTSVKLVLIYRNEPCAGSTQVNATAILTQPVSATNPTTFTLGPLRLQCTYVYLYDAVTDTPLTSTDSVVAYTATPHTFVSAPILSIEAAWEIEECECECWIYNLLYGDSPYKNLTYAEKEDALRNVTDQIEKELSVNKSDLSATIRKKTSAGDRRPSATVIGYTLGVALLVVSFGLIFLADVPRIIGTAHTLRDNLKSRFTG